MDRIYTSHRHGERRIHIEIAENELADLLDDFQDIAVDDNAYDATKKLIEILRAAGAVFAEDRKSDAHEAEISRT
jgi:hypothetical protein